MDAHGVKIFYRADDHEIIAEIAHHLELEFLPAQHGFLDERLMHGAGVQGARNQVREFLAIVRNRAARASQRERRPNHHGITEFVRKTHGVGHRGDNLRRGNFKSNLAARVFKEQAIFGDFDGAQRRANQLHIIFLKNSGLGELHGEI